MSQPNLAQAFLQNFLGSSPPWYKHTIVGFLPVENYGKWSYDNPKFLILNLALGGAYPYKTNLVKNPYNGIPESTVNSIKEGKGKVIVDWVSVVKTK